MMLASQQDILKVVVGVLDVLWMSCIIFMVMLVFMRKLILCKYGCPTGLEGWLVPWLDARKLKEIAETKASKKERVIFEWISVLIPTLYIIGAILMIGAVILHADSS